MSTHLAPELNVTHALEATGVPAYVIDRQGKIRWLNRGARTLIGNRMGQHFGSVVAPEARHLARKQFARKLIDGTATDYDLLLLDREGRRRPVRISSVPLRQDAKILGVFGLACPAGAAPARETARRPDARALDLTPRQYEALALLADGLGTSAIAARLGIAEETARNHIRALLRQLGVHSRLEAVVLAYRIGLFPRPRDL